MSAEAGEHVEHAAKHAAAERGAQPPRRGARFSVSALLDGFFFVFAAVAAIWLATIVFGEGFQWRWSAVWYFLAFWLLLAYLVLPRLHRILTAIYVPDYFIGRARTSDGLLGDPINLAILGTDDELHAAMARAGWTRADDVTGRSSWRIVTSTITRRSYDEAPVSPLFLFGRQQDFAYQQEVEGNPAKRHHVRFWRCPDGWLLPGGHRVDWMAAGTFDRAVGFSLFTLQITHKIDADTDVERDHIIATVHASSPDARVDVIRDFSTGYHSRNGGGDSIVTDGDMPVLDLRAAVEEAAEEAAGQAADATPVTGRRAARSGAPATAAMASVSIMGNRVSPGPPAAPATGIRASHAAPAAPGKRAAFEPGLDLARREDQPTLTRRPVQTTLGVVLVLLRVLSGVVWLVALSAEWSDIVAQGADVSIDGSADDAAASIVLWMIIGFGVVVLGIEVVLALFCFRGGNRSRIALLSLATLSILTAAGEFFAGGAQITIRTTLLTLSLDILILLALSSRAARGYARTRSGG